jgi:hypothetical protein
MAFVFVLTYDPKSHTLDNIITENAKCKEGHYTELQFAQHGYECPQGKNTHMGAVISK